MKYLLAAYNMYNQKEIEKFYTDVEKLGLKFPVAAISKATKFSKGNVSDYLNRNKEPSENFLKAFYREFYKSSTGNGPVDDPDTLKSILNKQNTLLETQNFILRELKDGIQDKVIDTNLRVATIETSLDRATVGMDTLQLEVYSARQVVLKSLARIENPKGPEDALLKEADNIVKKIRGTVEKKGKHD